MLNRFDDFRNSRGRKSDHRQLLSDGLPPFSQPFPWIIAFIGVALLLGGAWWMLSFAPPGG